MSDSEDGAPSGAAPEARPQMPIGGMVRDPREIKAPPTLTRFLRERITGGIIGSLVAIGVVRPKLANGDLGRRSWRGLFTFLLSVFAIIMDRSRRSRREGPPPWSPTPHSMMPTGSSG